MEPNAHISPSGRPFLILSIDGGGVRGIIPAVILARLEKELGKRVHEMFNLVSGTSTGGILVMGLLKPADVATQTQEQQPEASGTAADKNKNKNENENENEETLANSDDNSSGLENKRTQKSAFSAQDMVQFYEQQAPFIFSRNLTEKLWSVWGYRECKYSADGLKTVLQKYIGGDGLKLSHTLCDCLITTYDLAVGKPMFFKSRKARLCPGKHDYDVTDVVRSTTAAPTYFDPHLLTSPDGTKTHILVDGGVFANNPSMCAFTEAKKFYYKDVHNTHFVDTASPVNTKTSFRYRDPCDNTQSEGISASSSADHDLGPYIRKRLDAHDIILVSLGTGSVKMDTSKPPQWGALEWVRPLIDVMISGVAETTDYQLKEVMPKENYFRLDCFLDPLHSMLDDTSPANIQYLKQCGEEITSSSRFQELVQVLKNIFCNTES